jgi:hypothetical protein
LASRKKILTVALKFLIGVGCVLLIYIRLKSDFTPDKLALLKVSAFSQSGMLLFALCVLLVPLNWGIESYKWMLLTAPVEKVSFGTAVRSVYSGVCLGNLAPGRATEFVAKIIFFDIENRPKITLLHFIGGMFQLAVTIIAGLTSLFLMLYRLGNNLGWMVWLAAGVGIALLIGLALAIYNIDPLLKFITRKISHKKQMPGEFEYSFTPKLLFQITSLCTLRYAVFYLQFMLLILILNPVYFGPEVLTGIACFFLVTTILPMISVLEAAIRAAIALVVFKGADISHTALALSSVLLWLLNIILPSVYGYVVLLKQNFNFKLFKTRG